MKRSSHKKLDKEVVLSAAKLTNAEARLVISGYYMAQDQRKAFDSGARHVGDKGPEAENFLEYISDISATLEKEMSKSLSEYVKGAGPVGDWMTAQVGIGPVISAGCLAHIDMDQCPTAGHIWSFAGLNPERKWNSAEFVRGMVSTARKGHDDWTAFLSVCEDLHVRPTLVLKNADIVSEELSVEAAREYLETQPVAISAVPYYHGDNLLKNSLSAEQLPAAYSKLTGESKLDWKALTKALSKRPYNAQLKQISYHMGEGFKRKHNIPGCFYGQIYKQRKDFLVARNEAGYNAERAKTFRTNSAEVKKLLVQGKLPPINLDRQACNYAAKIFFSHLHAVWYWHKYNRLAPRPYAIEILGHAHIIEIPHVEEFFPGLAEAERAVRPTMGFVPKYRQPPMMNDVE